MSAVLIVDCIQHCSLNNFNCFANIMQQGSARIYSSTSNQVAGEACSIHGIFLLQRAQHNHTRDPQGLPIRPLYNGFQKLCFFSEQFMETFHFCFIASGDFQILHCNFYVLYESRFHFVLPIFDIYIYSA